MENREAGGIVSRTCGDLVGFVGVERGKQGDGCGEQDDEQSAVAPQQDRLDRQQQHEWDQPLERRALHALPGRSPGLCSEPAWLYCRGTPTPNWRCLTTNRLRQGRSMGKGDLRTRKGKIYNGSFGKKRPGRRKPAAPKTASPVRGK